MNEDTPLEHDAIVMNEEVVEDTKEAPLVRWKKVTQTGGPVPRPRHGHRSVAVKDLIVIFGGGNEGIVDEIHIYNTATNQWVIPALRGEIPSPCAAFGVVASGTRILMFGGMLEYGRYTNDLHELQATRWEWRRLRPRAAAEGYPCARLGHTFAISQKTQKTYIFGGLANDSKEARRNIPRYLNDLFILDVSVSQTSLQWEKPETHGEPPSPRESHTAVIHETSTSRNMIIYGGMNGSRLGDLWFLDLDSLTWTQLDIDPFSRLRPEPRSLHTAVTIDDKMYVYGGWVPMSSQTDESYQLAEKEWKCTSSLACFDLTNRRWQPLQLYSYDEERVPRSRAGHSAAVIGSRMYIWSGRDGYRKAWSNQVCCRDFWVLETMKPEQPGRVQLIRASFNSLDISWSSVPTAEAYLVQIALNDQKNDGAASVKQAGTGDSAAATPSASTPNAAAASGSVVKLIRGSDGQQHVVRVVKPPGTAPVVANKPKTFIISEKDGNSTKVVYLSNEVSDGMQESQKNQPNAQSMISTQGTTYTSASSLQQQTMDEGGLPQNLLDESGVDDAAPSSPQKAASNSQSTEGQGDTPMDCGDSDEQQPQEPQQQQDSDEMDPTPPGDEVAQLKDEQKPEIVPKVEAGSETKAENPEDPAPSQLGEEVKPNLGESTSEDEVGEGASAAAAAQAAAELEAQTHWYDIGLMKAVQCNVSHYFSSGYQPLENTIAEIFDQEYFDQNCMLVASSEKIPKTSKTSLESGTSYRFRVAAVNGLGRGAWSEVSTFKTCLPGFPSAPSSIRITKGLDGAQLTWEPPGNASIAGRISEYSVYLAVKNSSGTAESQLAFMRVYVGAEAECVVPQSNLQSAYVDQTNKPAIIFRIAARNEKGYGPATQVRWLQDQKTGITAAARYPIQSSGPQHPQPHQPPFQYHQGSTLVKRARLE